MRFAGDAMSGDYVQAGANGSNAFATTSKKTPNYGTLGNISMAEQSKEKQASIQSGAKVAGAGVRSLGAVAEAQNSAKAGLAAAESKASATQFGGLTKMLGGLGVSAIGQFGGGGGTDTGASGFDLNANYGGF